MIDERDRGFLLGDGVFETVLAANRVALWLTEHLQRMKKAARKLDLPFDQEAVERAVAAKIETPSLSVVRITLTRGVTDRGLATDCTSPTLHVSCDPFDPSLIGKPLRLATSSIRRNPQSVTDRHKTISYANNIFASREAKTRGADDALMLNQDGFVTCTTMANIFILNEGKLVSPPEQDGVLPGIMRRFIIEQSGLTVEVRSIEKDELREAEAVFATNSLRLVAPVTMLDGEDLLLGDHSRLMESILAHAKMQCGINILEKLT
jgi:branched-chain amino acid aminotransferase